MAIELWFTERDQISIYTLAWASLQLLHDLGSRPGVEKPSDLLMHIRKLPKKQRHRSGLVTAIGKHADRRYSTHNVVEYPAGITEDVIYEAICCFWKLFDDLTPWMRLFAVRYIATHFARVFSELALPELLKLLGGKEYLAGLSRREFLEEVLPVLAREDFSFAPPKQT